MGDAYWRYAQARQAAAAVPPSVLLGKRARPDFDVLGGHDLTGYYGRDDGRGAPRGMREGDSLAASYERYLRGGQHGSLPIDDPRNMGLGGADLPVAKRQSLGAGGAPETHLPPDASETLFVEGLPANCSRREVAHIFRPFVGYKEVRLVTKDSRRSKGDALVLCFVDFLSPAHAATAMDALQDSRC